MSLIVKGQCVHFTFVIPFPLVSSFSIAGFLNRDELKLYGTVNSYLFGGNETLVGNLIRTVSIPGGDATTAAAV